jgi:hypothetical protein
MQEKNAQEPAEEVEMEEGESKWTLAVMFALGMTVSLLIIAYAFGDIFKAVIIDILFKSAWRASDEVRGNWMNLQGYIMMSVGVLVLFFVGYKVYVILTAPLNLWTPTPTPAQNRARRKRDRAKIEAAQQEAAALGDGGSGRGGRSGGSSSPLGNTFAVPREGGSVTDATNAARAREGGDGLHLRDQVEGDSPTDREAVRSMIENIRNDGDDGDDRGGD